MTDFVLKRILHERGTFTDVYKKKKIHAHTKRKYEKRSRGNVGHKIDYLGRISFYNSKAYMALVNLSWKSL